METLIHTGNLWIEFCNRSDYWQVYNSLKSVLKHKRAGSNKKNLFNIYTKNQTGYFTTHFMKEEGFSEIIFARHFGKKSGCFLGITVNFPQLIYNDGICKLAKIDDIAPIKDRFRECIEELNLLTGIKLKLPSDINVWKLNRIDYAFDIIEPRTDYYISLFNKGRIPRGFELKRYYDDSFQIRSDNRKFNFYNKTKELAAKHNLRFDVSILRLEVQCFTDYINKLAKKFGIDAKCIEYFWRLDIALYVVEKALDSVIASADFNKYSELNIKADSQGDALLKLLKNTPLSVSDIQQLFPPYRLSNDTFIRLAMELYLIHNAVMNEEQLEFLLTANGKFCMRNALYELKKQGINPITIKEEYDTNKLENPIQLIREQL